MLAAGPFQNGHERVARFGDLVVGQVEPAEIEGEVGGQGGLGLLQIEVESFLRLGNRTVGVAGDDQAIRFGRDDENALLGSQGLVDEAQRPRAIEQRLGVVGRTAVAFDAGVHNENLR